MDENPFFGIVKPTKEILQILTEVLPVPEQRIVVMAAGNSHRWNNYMGIPKQLVPIDGEPLLKRTIRQLRERGVQDIYVTVREYGQFGALDAKEYIKDVNELDIDRVWGARELAPCIFLYGDCYYTEDALDTILSHPSECMFFGKRFPNRMKGNREIYAIKANDWLIEKAGELRKLHEQKKVSNSLGQHLHLYCIGFPLNPRTKNFIIHPKDIGELFTDIDDMTMDFDKPAEYKRFLNLKGKRFALKPTKLGKTQIYLPVKVYYTVERLNHDIVHKFLPKLPVNLDLIVGIPRDGMLVATLVSVYRNIPFTDLMSFKQARIYRPGIKHRQEEGYYSEVKTVLLVDDICATGRGMTDAIAQISSLKKDFKIYTGVVYVNKDKTRFVDYYAALLVRPCHFEWTHGDSVQLPGTIFDMDGVLCLDCPKEDDDDGERYHKFLTNVPAKLCPQNIGMIVTWRHAKYRELTEEWLRKHRITYSQLLMAEREKWSGPVEYKAYHYKNSNTRLFIDSSSKQAEKIAQLAGKPVIGYDTNQIFGNVI